MIKRVSLTVCILGVLSLLSLYFVMDLQAYGKGSKKTSQETVTSKVFEGTLICIGCNLKKNHGVHAQCSIYGHKHGLQMKDGTIWSFVENGNSETLIKGEDWHNDQIVRIYGKALPKTQYIDVEKYEVKDENGKWVEYNWCDMCKTMVPPGHTH